jgi:nucleotide-binding universal stress UspA family protein
VLIGRPDAEIVAYADKSAADLIVMGTHGRSGIGHAILGSVAERVVQHAHRPVLIVPFRKSPSP